MIKILRKKLNKEISHKRDKFEKLKIHRKVEKD